MASFSGAKSGKEGMCSGPRLLHRRAASTACASSSSSAATFIRAERALGKFSPRETLQAEMERLSKASNQEYTARIVELNKKLVESVADEFCSLHQIRSVVDTLRENELLQWTVSRMFSDACVLGRHDIAAYMVGNGVRCGNPGISESFALNLLRSKPKSTSIRILNLLYGPAGFDVNHMDIATGTTALHVAVENCEVEKFKLLLVLGADVNAIALGPSGEDVLPLTMCNADDGCDTSEQKEAKRTMGAYLRTLGARERFPDITSG